MLNLQKACIGATIFGSLWLLGATQLNLDSPAAPVPLFEELSAERTGIQFANRISENNQVNFYNYEYLYNGGGVAVADFNQDGQTDIYFVGNMSLNRLYLNRGDFRFEDVTAIARASTQKDWCTGVTVVDINADGKLDLYVSASGWFEDENIRRNLLFVNQGNNESGIPIFEEQAAQYGIDDPGYSTQASFFDYDRDGDLDLYVANHPREFREYAGDVLDKMANPPTACRDRLYRNDGDRFTDVSDAAGIVNYAHTLGLITSDLDRDGWVDVYVSNDYQGPDYFYRNNGDGTFTDIAQSALKHMAKFSMGVDAADFNNDTWPDLLTVEMLAEDNKRQKTNMAPMNPKEFWAVVSTGFGYQYMHNCLQLNLGHQPGTDQVVFGEISYLAGVASTDWSWAPLFADFDLDGYQDLFISNGYRRDMLDKDFSKKVKAKLATGKVRFEDLAPQIPSSKQANYLFRNRGEAASGLQFDNQSQAWGLARAVNSNGAAYADFDGDGDLDLVLNHMDEPATLYRNRQRETRKQAHYLKVQLKGPAENPLGIGAKIVLELDENRRLYREMTLTRGFQSSVTPVLHLGLGMVNRIPSLLLTWPDGRIQRMEKVEADQTLILSYEEAHEASLTKQSKRANSLLIAETIDAFEAHQESAYDDYSDQVLLPHKLSEEGPALAAGDVNQDGWPDLFVGGGADQAPQLYLQKPDGTWIPQLFPAWDLDRAHEDIDALFFDADQDGDQDLYVVSGSYEFPLNDPRQQDRLYLNNGYGSFQRAEEALPTMPAVGSCVRAADWDADGDLDLFVGGRVVPGRYPEASDSYLLENKGGRFEMVTPSIAPDLQTAGMVTDALWTDYDGDQDIDLMVVGEWMPISIWENQAGRLVRKEFPELAQSAGWWQSLASADMDQDGDPDYLLGNLGLNSKNQASTEYPFYLYADDFDANGSLDLALGYFQDGFVFPVRGLQCSSEQVPRLAEEIPSYAQFGSLSLAEIYGESALEAAIHLEAHTFASSYLENLGQGRFVLRHLPLEAQVAPVRAQIILDLNKDGHLDVLLAGNQYGVEVETGRYDASYGLCLLGNGKGDFKTLHPNQSGFWVDGQISNMVRVSSPGQKIRLYAQQNNGPGRLFKKPN